jgi:hypothetical protein
MSTIEKPLLHRATFEFSQDGNTCGTTKELEELTIEFESPAIISGPDDCFIVIKTDTGWSMDSIDELAELIEKCKKSF